MVKYFYYTFALFVLIQFTSCESAPNLPNVDHIEVDAKIVRFDQALNALDTNNLEKEFSKLKIQYPALTELMFKQIIPIQEKESVPIEVLKDFLSNKYTQHGLDTIQKLLPDLSKEEKSLKKSFQYFKHYFPEALLPKVYAGYSDYGFQTFIFDDYQSDGICASLDLYLGEDYPYKEIDPKNPAFSDYITRRYDRKFMVKKIVELMVEDQIGALQGKRMIDHMVYQGKKWYILKRLLPQFDESMISEFTNSQWDWCKTNEKEVWSYFLDKNLLYETNQQKIKSYVFEGPKSFGMPEAAPGRTAHYLGWKMIEQYMDETKMSISDLIQEKDSQRILKLSKYKPKRK